MIADNYYYHCLTKENQSVYKKMYDSILKFERSFTIEGIHMDQSDFHEICHAITKDNPFFYYIDISGFVYKKTLLDHYEIDLCYLITKEKHAELDEKIKKNAKAIIGRADIQGKSEAQIVKSIHDVLVRNIVYDKSSVELKTNELDGLFAHTILGVLLKKSAVCDGMSATFKYLLNAVGIHCLIVYGDADSTDGTNSDIRHTWNIVKINKKNYHIDLTWDVSTSFDGNICYDYYCLTDDLIGADHYDFDTMPKCVDDDENYFVKNKIVVDSEFELEEYLRNNLKSLPCNLYFKISFDTDMDTVINMIKDIMKENTYMDDYSGMIGTSFNKKIGIIRMVII